MRNKYSIEIVTNQINEVKYIPKELFEEIHIVYLPETDQNEILESCKVIQSLDFRPVPHCPARTLRTDSLLEIYLKKITDLGINKLLCIGGNFSNQPDLVQNNSRTFTTFKETMDVFSSGLLEKYNINEVNIAGFPEGNINDPNTNINLIKKCDWLNQKNIRSSIITQWTTNERKTNQWITETKKRTAKIDPQNFSIHLGVVGPINLKRLIRYADICGVSPKRLIQESEIKRNHDPLEYFERLIPKTLLHEIIPFDNLHFYPFGGIKRLVKWLMKNPSLI